MFEPKRLERRENILLQQLFEESADKYSEKTAILFEGKSTTYRQLEEDANRVASYIMAQHIPAGSPVLLMMEKSEFLYAAMLGILKAGCAYVPIDPSVQFGRLAYIAADSDAHLFFTSQEILDGFGPGSELPGMIIVTSEKAASLLSEYSPARIPLKKVGINPGALFNMAYIIYTSGTTGKPKGCVIDHKNIINFIFGAVEAYGISEDDTVIQCASVSFDASLEEIWNAFACGGTLVPLTAKKIRSGDDIAHYAEECGVTVISCTPTFLTMLTGDIKTLRILILGGEACPEGLVEHWAKPDRTIFNSYGPTEGTVACIVGKLEPGKKIVLGKPIPGYDIFILNEKLERVPNGEHGEICIGGAGVIRGYLHLDAEDSKRFIMTTKLTGEPLCLYRTGDYGGYTENGDIAYYGRMDSQIKLRGFRIELSEIESVLLTDPAVQTAAVTVQNNTQLAAFVVVKPGKKLDRAALLAMMKEKLTPYMIPVFLDEIDRIPTSIAGKTDRKALPIAKTPFVIRQAAFKAPSTEAEKKICAVLKELFSLEEISVTDDFFLDLGGDSLSAAIASSKIRLIEGYETVSIGDIYHYKTVEILASAKYSKSTNTAEKPQERYNPPLLRRMVCGLFQLVAMVPLFVVLAWQWLGIFASVMYLVEFKETDFLPAIGYSVLYYIAVTAALFFLTIACKWIFLGRIKSETFKLYGIRYFSYWFIRTCIKISPLWMFKNTPVNVLFYRLMGAKIGKNVLISDCLMCAFDILEIEDGVIVKPDANINTFTVVRGMCSFKPIHLKKNCIIGDNTMLSGDNVVGENAELGMLSKLEPGVTVPDNQYWCGSPAVFVNKREPVSSNGRNIYGPVNLILMSLFTFCLPALYELFFVPGIFIGSALLNPDDSLIRDMLLTPFYTLFFILLLTLIDGVYGRILFACERKNVHSLREPFYFCYWIYENCSTYIHEICNSLFGTMYSRLWMKLRGIDVGKGSEISYAVGLIPKYTHIGKNSFLADNSRMICSVIENGVLSFKHTTNGNRSFIGNSADVYPGTTIPDDCLIGVLSVSPAKGMSKGTSWFGSPAIYIPARGKETMFSDETTYSPPLKSKIERGIFDFFKMVLPLSLSYIIAEVMLYEQSEILYMYSGFNPIVTMIIADTCIYIVCGIINLILVLALKWIMLGKVKEERHPLWSLPSWKKDLFTGLFENLIIHFFLHPLTGTPFINFIYRIFGSHIGKNVFISTLEITEFDLVTVGDNTDLNEQAGLQTHLFENRVMKCGKVEIKSGCSIEASCIILYDTVCEEGVVVTGNTLIMKSEHLPANTTWSGIPANKIQAT